MFSGSVAKPWCLHCVCCAFSQKVPCARPRSQSPPRGRVAAASVPGSVSSPVAEDWIREHQGTEIGVGERRVET